MADRKNYWTEKHENLCKEWLSADTKQQFRIYAELCPAINLMIEIIQNRYFQIPTARQTEMKWNIVSHVFCNLNKFNPNQKAFAWLGYVIKNKIYEEIDYYKKKAKYNKRIELEYPEEMPDVSVGIDYGEYTEFDVEAFRKRIKALKKKYSTISKKQKTQSAYTRKLNKQQNIITILTLMEEYVTKYESFNSVNILEYIQFNSNITRYTAGNYLYMLFGRTVRPLPDDYIRMDERHNYNYENDDWTPDQDVVQSRTNRKRIKQKFGVTD